MRSTFGSKTGGAGVPATDKRLATGSDSGPEGAAIQPDDRLVQLGRLDGFGQVVVHAVLEASLPVARHGVGGEGDDDDLGVLRLPELASRICRVASMPSMTGICTSMRIKVVALLPRRLQGLGAVARDVGREAQLLERLDGDLLVHQIVLGQQDPRSPTRSLGQRVPGDDLLGLALLGLGLGPCSGPTTAARQS